MIDLLTVEDLSRCESVYSKYKLNALLYVVDNMIILNQANAFSYDF